MDSTADGVRGAAFDADSGRFGPVTLLAAARNPTYATLVHHHGSSVHPDRQTGPRPHMIGVDPVSGDLLVPDLGIDAVLGYRLGDRPDTAGPAGPVAEFNHSGPVSRFGGRWG